MPGMRPIPFCSMKAVEETLSQVLESLIFKEVDGPTRLVALVRIWAIRQE